MSKWFLAMTTLFVFSLTQTACTQQKQDINPNPQTAAPIAQNDTKVQTALAPANVLDMTGVKVSGANKMVDFTFLKDGKEMLLSDLAKGKYVFLNFWGTWCPPCRAEIPYIIEISKELQKDLLVVGVTLERTGEIETARKTVSDFVTAKGIPYTNFVMNLENRNKITEAYGGIQYVPTTFLIDKEGNIVETIQGGRSKEQFMESINKMLKK